VWLFGAFALPGIWSLRLWCGVVREEDRGAGLSREVQHKQLCGFVVDVASAAYFSVFSVAYLGALQLK